MSARPRESLLVRTVSSDATRGCDETADLCLRFDSSLSAGAVQIDSPQQVRLSTSWQGLRADYGPFALKHLFVQRLLDLKPAQVVVDGLNVASAELLRCAHALGLRTQCVAEPPQTLRSAGTAHDRRWLAPLLQLSTASADPGSPQAPAMAWDYGLYSMGLRDHALLQQLNQPALEQLATCRTVLDVGCGTGVLLDQLLRHGVSACGVERDAACVRYAQSLGLDVTQADALVHLETLSTKFEGIVCSHFVEHLDIETVKRLIRGIASALQDDGMAVLVFPDPESIRSQLLGFWRDPEHVRFYHPELIISLARVEGLICEFNSIENPSRAIGSFPLKPPEWTGPATARAPSWRTRLARRLGLTPWQDVEQLQAQLSHQTRLIEQLWRVNQTWGWEDNAVIRLRKVRA